MRNLDGRARNTRYGLNLHPPVSNLALITKSTQYMDLKVFNSLPSCIMGRQQDVNEFKQFVRIFFIVILSPHWKNTSIVIKLKYLNIKEVNNFIYTVLYTLNIFKY
jgi:hypothetical protein